MTELCGTQISIREDTSKDPITGWPVTIAARRTCRDIVSRFQGGNHLENGRIS